MNIKGVQIATIVLLAASVVLVWQITDIYTEKDILRGKIDAQETIVKDSEDALKKLNNFIDFTEENKEAINKFDLILPADEDKASLLANLNGLAIANGLSALKIIFDDKAKPAIAQNDTAVKIQDFDTQIVKMSLRGGYISFKNFLASVEKNLRVADVAVVDFAAESSSKGAEVKEEIKTYSYNIELKTYFFKPLKEENIAKLLNSGKFMNFTAKDLSFTKEKIFKDLFLPSDHNLNTGVDEIGNQNIF